MIRFKTLLRNAGIVVLSLWSTAASAQSVLNFTARGGGAVGITNPSPYDADVKFTLYNADGSIATGVLNPVSGRIPGKGQITSYYSRIFGAPTGGWVQVTSPVSGLQGSYFTGDSASSFDSEATSPQLIQVVPYPIPSSRTSLIVTNPATRSTNVTATFYDAAGNVVAGGGTFPLAGHAQASLPGNGASARISADAGVLASAVQVSDNREVVIHGQGERSRSQRLVAPYFKNQSSTNSLLVLNNPSGQEVQARVTFSGDNEGTRLSAAVRIRPNGSASLDWAALLGSSVAVSDEGWLLVESNAPMNGLVVVSSKGARTALPLQSAPANKMLFSRFVDGADFTANLSLVGSAERDATATITLSRPDGSTVASNQVSVPALQRSSSRLRDLLPIPEAFPQGFITVQATTPVYGVEILETEGDFVDSGIVPLRLPAGYQPSAPVPAPQILGVSVVETPEGRKQLSITALNLDNNPQLFVGGKLTPILQVAVAGTQFSVLADIPALEPGYIYVKIRANGIDSNTYFLGVYPDGATFIQRTGQAVFQKIEITNTGLDVSRTVMVPIRNARVEIIERATGKILSVTETDENGWFLAAVPDRPGLTIQVLSRLRSAEVKILDNMSGNRLYAIRKDFDDPRDPLDIVDTSRVSGAFNILDVIQRANSLVAQADPQTAPPPVTIYWSEKNNDVVLSRLTGGLMKTTFFNLSTNTAYVLGDRNTDSDEFDDSVILHEYAHMLAARFSRDDSPGGTHAVGELLDPRLAWSEGWANFFSSAVRGTSIFIDSKGPGVVGVRYDLEDNSPAGDSRGFYSEASVHGLLWDLFDEGVDDGDSVQFPFAAIWKAFSDLRNDRYVYLPDFLENFVKDNPGVADVLRTMVNLRNIDFDPMARPSVISSFPNPIAVGETRPATAVDSFTARRTNLATSSHFYSFTTTSAGQASVILNIEGLGPANNPDANDLDLYLYDSNGKRIAQSNQFLNGQAEYILGLPLAAGTYYIEVRSFYTRADYSTVYNSGRYRLSLQMTP